MCLFSPQPLACTAQSFNGADFSISRTNNINAYLFALTPQVGLEGHRVHVSPESYFPIITIPVTPCPPTPLPDVLPRT